LIGVEEDRMFELLAKARNQGNNFVDTKEIALSLECADQHGHVQSLRRSGNSLQPNKIGHIKMADCGWPVLRVGQCLFECYHRLSARTLPK
jgi:hypothetical protein